MMGNKFEIAHLGQQPQVHVPPHVPRSIVSQLTDIVNSGDHMPPAPCTAWSWSSRGTGTPAGFPWSSWPWGRLYSGCFQRSTFSFTFIPYTYLVSI